MLVQVVVLSINLGIRIAEVEFLMQSRKIMDNTTTKKKCFGLLVRVFRVPLMLGLSDPSMRSMMDLSGNFFVPASFLEFVYALCNQQSILALPFEHIDDWRRGVVDSGAGVEPVDFRVVTSRAGTFSALFTVKTTACKGVRWMSPGQLRAAGIAVGKRSFSSKKSKEAYTSCCKAHVACARAAQLAARAASEAAVDPAEVAADASRAASRLASAGEPAAGAFTTPKRRRRSKAKPTPPPKPPAPPPRSTASISFDALASSSDSVPTHGHTEFGAFLREPTTYRQTVLICSFQQRKFVDI